MTTIYIVKNDIGEYDDHFEKSLCAVSSEEKATELVNLFIELNTFNIAFDKRMYNEFRRVWESQNPRPQMADKPKPPDGFHDLQRACAANKEAHDLKVLYKKLQNQHHENLKLYNVEVDKYRERAVIQLEAYKIAELEWYNKNYILPPHLSEVAKISDEANHGCSNSGNKYSYYELTLFQ